ncbi:DUF1932 domain-containing protein [Gammaproteobacteria bacterium]|nr:DUF1932 domain-containing protein [Gammaproteobacteria bacterium]
MEINKVGFLHPGEMGISLANAAKSSDQEVFWCSAGRSQATVDRANEYKLTALNSLEELCSTCNIIISVCPPHAAAKQAQAVIDAGFKGIYADVNAISPQSAKAIADSMENAGIAFVDGGIVGLPAWKSNSTWLYLCGKQAETIASCFTKGPLETTVIGEEIGKASALKMCFAANSKGVSAMLTAILATAEEFGVRDALEKQWDIYNPGFALQSKTRIQTVARKAWRFTGEMEEIAATFESVGLPPEFHLAAANIYARQTEFKDREEAPSIEEILATCLKKR